MLPIPTLVYVTRVSHDCKECQQHSKSLKDSNFPKSWVVLAGLPCSGCRATPSKALHPLKLKLSVLVFGKNYGS